MWGHSGYTTGCGQRPVWAEEGLDAHRGSRWPVAGWSASFAESRGQEAFRLRVAPEDDLAVNSPCFSFTRVGWSASWGGSLASGLLRLVFGAGSTRPVRFLPFLLTPVQGALRLGTSVPWTDGSGSR